MSFPSSRPPALVIALAAIVLAALLTIVGLFVLRLGPFAPGAPSNPPTARPTSQMTVGPSIAPSTLASQSASNSAPPSGSPPVSPPPATSSSATDALLAHVPETLRPTCAPASFEHPVLAVVACTGGEGAVAITYTLYADQPSMAAVYDSGVIAAGIDDNSGRCYNRNDAGEIVVTISRWPSENGYNIRDEPVGRYLCHDDGTTATLTWTDERVYVLASGSTQKANVDRLISFWIDEAGPIE